MVCGVIPAFLIGALVLIGAAIRPIHFPADLVLWWWSFITLAIWEGGLSIYHQIRGRFAPQEPEAMAPS